MFIYLLSQIDFELKIIASFFVSSELLKWSQPWLLLTPTPSADLEDLVEADLVGFPHLFAARDDLENKILM